jgi:heme/copper-type cytochrome/quinol oxidase subunit 2
LEKIEKEAKQMKHEMNRNPRTWLLLVLLPILIVAAILAATWATSTFWYPRLPWQPPERPPYIQWDIEFFYIAKTVISTINVIILVFLVIVYADIYRKTRSEFTVGLIIFSATLLLYALTSNPIVIRAFGFRLFGLGPFALLPDVFTFVALIILLYLSIKY